jgi:hypothetical protein
MAPEVNADDLHVYFEDGGGDSFRYSQDGRLDLATFVGSLMFRPPMLLLDGTDMTDYPVLIEYPLRVPLRT